MRDSAAFDTHSVVRHCAQRLARYMVPRSLDFIDELPRLPTGKLYKRVLKEQYARADRSRSGSV